MAITIALPALALLIGQLLWRWLNPTFEPLFIAGTAIAAWFCGVRYAIACTLLSALILDYFFLPPYNSIAPGDAPTTVKFFLFLASCVVITGLILLAQSNRSRLAESELRYRNLAELIPFGGWMADSRGNMVRLSESFLNTFCVNLDECKGLGWIRLIEEADRSKVLADWRECMRHGYFWDYEYRMRSRSGDQFVVLSRGIPVDNARGQGRVWVGIHLDVTERERLAETRIEQARDIARFNAELEQFAYVSAHDLQEPLRMIASYLQLLSRRYKGKLDDEADTFINYAVEGADRLKSLLQDLLELQQVGASGRPRRIVSLQSIVNKAVANLSLLIQETGAEITCAELPSISCDEQAFIQLFRQLIDNAIKYRRKDVPPKVSISASAAARAMWNICIEDNGMGIPVEFHQKIFNVFQRLHPRDMYAGTGIGLAICKKIVEAHGGQIWVESVAGQGSRFYFSVPVSRQRAA